jgi:hypothetical protein
MKSKRWNYAKLVAIALGCVLNPTPMLGQGTLLVDQASGTLDELIQVFTLIPDNQIAQSFTPSLSAVGFVQLQTVTFQDNNGAGVVFAVNLRQGTYNGPIVSSTDPVVLIRGPIQVGTFSYPDNIPVTPGQRYVFEPVLLSAGSLDIGYKNPSSYLGGDAWNNGLQDTGDYWFREGIVVPEPGPVWLFLLGGVLLFYRRTGRMS